MMLGVVDACFLIDWSRYRRRELLASLFKAILVHEEVLAPAQIPFSYRLRLTPPGQGRAEAVPLVYG